LFAVVCIKPLSIDFDRRNSKEISLAPINCRLSIVFGVKKPIEMKS